MDIDAARLMEMPTRDGDRMKVLAFQDGVVLLGFGEESEPIHTAIKLNVAQFVVHAVTFFDAAKFLIDQHDTARETTEIIH